MLTKRELEGIGLVFKGCCALGLLPYDWDSANFKLSAPTKSRTKRVVSAMSVSYMWLYCSFKCCRIPDFLETPNWRSQWTVYYIYVICWLTVASIHYNSLSQGIGVVNVVNCAIDFNFREGQRYFRQQYAKNPKRESFVIASLVSLVVFALSMTFFFFMFPKQYHFWYAAVPQVLEQSSVAFWIFFALEAYAAFSLCMVYTFAMVIQFMYVVTMKFWLKSVCVQWPLGRKMGGFRDVKLKELLIMFRKLKLLNGEYNRSHSHFVTPALILSNFSLGVQSCYATVRYIDLLPVEMLVVSGIMCFMNAAQLLTGTSLVASLHGLSGSCKRNFTDLVVYQKIGGSEREICHREIMNCRPVGFQVGSLYIIKRETKTTIFHMLINTVAGLLLT